MKVLIIDSSKEIIQRLEEMLLETGAPFKVKSALSYREGMELFHLHPPRIILLGMGMDANAAIGFLEEVRQHSLKVNTMVLFISLPEYVKEKCSLLGVTHFIDKYRDFEVLPDLIREIMTRQLSESLQ
ncbi:two-component system response regulator [Parasegetibacter sp. NRK P23]|uniref:response regulator n=1 Tax=Parasegetibacter sp. NRK P23 TaxID=2942999 RepID=UPI002042E7DB|nr:response regulator [Parasegetibacter sp. NRK P23]MCM5527754.1 response regulator [Parasegetibacter sp. NRK P23]